MDNKIKLSQALSNNFCKQPKIALLFPLLLSNIVDNIIEKGKCAVREVI